ncbi:atlastin-like isoform X1 [Zophobas morio]|uniref:atlastin-like isoform X1 n=2 Tax=Zophobas morio TaxID=2755281 RepID=UPI003082FD4F
MAFAYEPSAKQIIDLSEGNKIAANEDTLRQVFLNPSVKDKPVCVVSINGTFQQGKSFLLNFFVRYLKLKYKLKKITSEKWLNAEDGNISGTAWKCGSDRHTVGILVWSEIFIAELPSGEEIAIVLLDSQGTFDVDTTMQDCAAIFAISTLISSVQIFNLKEKISLLDLEHLECFSGYGQLALQEGSRWNAAPFQNLWFLIRDWPYQFEFDFGTSGGQRLLTSVINRTTELTSELNIQKDNIRKLFENIYCCLLPHPGETVAKSPSFSGKLEDIDERFLKHVEEFVPKILSQENLVPKTINGEKIKVSDLFTFIQIYCDYFSGGNVPPLPTMYMATAEAQLKIAVTESGAMYKEAMDEIVLVDASLENDVLEGHHLEQKQNAMDNFNNKKILGNIEIKRKFKTLLKGKLDQRFIEYRRLNRVKQEKEKEIAYQQQAFETHLREETEKVKKSQAEEIQRELEALRNKQNSLEQQLLEERKRRDEETLNLIMEKSREQLENQEQLQEKLATAYQHAFKTQLREETEKVKKIHDEEFQRELEALRSRQTSLEQQLLEKINKRGEETLNLIMEKSREQLENQKQQQENLATAYQHALKTQLREETENVKKIHDEEFQRELEALRDRQTSLEQQLLEKINKRGEETLNLIMEKLREQLENQEKLQEKLVTEIERRYEDKFAYQQQLLEEEIRRRTAQIESEQKSRLHELEMQCTQEKNARLIIEKNSLEDDKEKLLETLKRATNLAEEAKQEAQEAREEAQEAREKVESTSGCIIL